VSCCQKYTLLQTAFSAILPTGYVGKNYANPQQKP